MKSGRNTSKFTRRHFVLSALGIVPAAGMLLHACNAKNNFKHIGGGMVGNSLRGHLLRDKKMGTPSTIIQHDIVIVGGGVAGLSAARELKQKGISNFVLLELEDTVGGNAASGQNDVSAYPWGAHYLPVPDHRDKELLQLLETFGCITGYDDYGLPIYNELHLCFEPEERLFINGYWQEGLVPHFGVPAHEQKQVQKFFGLIQQFRDAKGIDGKDAFCIPLKLCSTDPLYRQFDKITMHAYLKEQGLTVPYLHWYVDYCCRDDYGTSIQNTSAWAGIHYFAARKGRGTNAGSSTVLTWPEGNAWLVNNLRKQLKHQVQTGALVYHINMIENDKVIVDMYNFVTAREERIICNKVILASPQFVNKRLLADKLKPAPAVYDKFSYAPWVVANITLPEIYDNKGVAMSWDNVFYGSKSLGYVDATHQQLSLFAKKKVLTWYLPLSDIEPKEARLEAYNRTYHEWLNMIVNDLEKAHRGITNLITHVDIKLWGHGMIRPLTGFIWGEERVVAGQPLNDSIFFAHSDLSGISVFEEAFHQGVDAARALIKSIASS